ncbi:MAG: HAD hydrolase-like protein [Verrucomicrobiota bacterium]|nr:HAD hydrolase-like protein [Verrucomicrobiota bacterium]
MGASINCLLEGGCVVGGIVADGAKLQYIIGGHSLLLSGGERFTLSGGSKSVFRQFYLTGKNEFAELARGITVGCNYSMIVFDVDGTLLGGEQTDWACFGAAFAEAAGFELTESFFATIKEVTAKAIVHEALASRPQHEKAAMEQAVCEGYLRRLEAAHAKNPGCFPATEGAVNLMKALQFRGIPHAIATGDWHKSITFKLRAATIPHENLPLVTSSDYYSRAEIIAEAVVRAGGSLKDAVYVGDGLWDLRACQALGITFIGIGHRREKLLAAGAQWVLNDLHPQTVFSLLREMQKVTDRSPE